MIKTNPYSYFVMKDLDGIVNCRGDIVLQAEKTGSVFKESQKPVYLCEVVSALRHDARTIESMAAEILALNKENRRLHNKIDRLNKQLNG